MRAEDFNDLAALDEPRQKYQEAGIDMMPVLSGILTKMSPGWHKSPAASVAWYVAGELLRLLDKKLEERQPRTRGGKLLRWILTLIHF